ncbi:MAG TPA: S8 family serine peptidase [Bacteroidota bacterium]|nr:S8 family serine peptidase [Bacteroidota bacterium]
MINGRRLLHLGIVLLGMWTLTAAADRYTPDILIVKLAPSSSVAALTSELLRTVPALRKTQASLPVVDQLFSAHPPRLEKSGAASAIGPERYLVVRFGNADDADAAYASLQHSNNVEVVQRNYIYTIDAVPNDSAVSSQWGLQRIGIMRLWNEGYFSRTHPVVKVGVLDTGIDYLHPDLAFSIAMMQGEIGTDAQGRDKRTNGIDDDGNGFVDDWHGYNFIETEGRGSDPADKNGHGTGVAGIIGAASNNGLGIAGVAGCALMPLRAFDATGNGNDADVAAAIIYGVDNGCAIINMSFGVTVLTPVMRDAVRYATAKNVLLVASSGNDGNEKPHYPSDLDGVIAVGSVSQYDSRSYFSSYGPPLALLAPGENIVTTQPGGGYTASFSGTSAAAPHVSGVAALVKSMMAEDSAQNPLPITNSEFRALLANSADDIGAPGWEKETGAGVLNAYKALNTLTHNTVRIESPAIDAVIPGGIVSVRGTAVFSGMKTLGVYVGAGEKPDTWTQLAAYENKYFFGDTVGVWNTDGYPEGSYTLRLAAHSIAGSDVEYRVRVYLKRSAPVITSFIVDDSVVIADEYGALARIDTDRPTAASLMFRPAGTSGAFIIRRSDGVQMHHSFFLTSKDMTPGVRMEVRCSVMDNAGQTASAPAQNQAAASLPTMSVGTARIQTSGFTSLSESLPSGYLLDAVGFVNAVPTIIMNQYDEANDFGKLKSYQFRNGAFVAVDSLSRQWVPRDIGIVNGDNVMASLVQDRGVTRIIASDSSSNKIFARDLFGDSTDVWGSQFYDVDHDGRLDIIARSSTEYLIYKNLGGNKFTVATHLPDPTPPLPGEAVNQFGPPKSAVGDFTGSGRTEIAFADYDGDVLLYRQSAADPFAFTLVWTDTSSLYETSEFITAADFDGDGIAELASAGHSNLDFNADREYDAPFWTVRIFSHAGSGGTMKKVWEKKIAGVHSGFQNDNGLSSGAVMPGGTQLLLSVNPYFYIVRFDPSTRTYAPVWITNGQTNAALVYDFNRNGTNEFGIHTDTGVRFYEYESVDASRQAPWGVTTQQTAEHVMRVRWNSTTPAADHAVYRDTVQGAFRTRIVAHGTEFVDSAVVAGVTYYYSIASLANAEGARSAEVSVKADVRPRMTSLETVSSSQLRITINAEADRSRFASAVIAVDDTVRARSVVSASTVGVVATFDPPLTAGAHTLRMERIYSLSGFENDASQRLTFNVQPESAQQFEIIEAKMEEGKRIRLRFNRTIARSTVRKENFTVRTIAKTFAIDTPALDANDSTIVVITPAGGGALTDLGLRVEITVSAAVTSGSGIPLNAGKGQTISFGITTVSLDHPVVFPNPLRYLEGLQEKISFVNIPTRCKVSIYTAAGHKVREQEDLSTPDGLTWDLRDDKGQLVSSGVYLYRLVHVDDSGGAIETTMGKFAIIR